MGELFYERVLNADLDSGLADGFFCDVVTDMTEGAKCIAECLEIAH